MKLKYVSQGGTVEMGGGGHLFSNISRMDGFGLPSPNYEEITYAGQNGVTTTGKTDLPRTMTITGDFYGGQKERMQVLKAFYYPGELYCSIGNLRRKISCKCINLSDIEKNCNSGINGFTVQLQADSPYFCDFFDTTVSLASYKNLITNEFTLPCAFTELITQGTVYNMGDIRCYPVITLTASPQNEMSETRGIYVQIKNSTTEITVGLDYEMRPAEIITINLPGRRIISSVEGNITNKITPETYMDKAYLEPGENTMKLTLSNKKQIVTGLVTFNNQYIMSV